MAITDVITLVLSLYFLGRGASRGFLLSLAGPFSIIAATVLSIIYYQVTGNLTISLIIGLVGPLLLNLLLKFLLKSWANATNSNIKPDFLSRLGGAGLTFVWGWVVIFFLLILLSLLPPLSDGLTAVRNDVTKSISYQAVQPLEKVFFGQVKENMGPVMNAASSNAAQSLAEDPRFQAVIQDPEVQKEIEARDFVKLMSNPKMKGLVQQIISDPAAMKKVMAVYSSQSQQAPSIKNP